MPNLVSGGTATLTLVENDLLSVVLDGGNVARYENPVGTTNPIVFSGDRSFGPIPAGGATVKLTSDFGVLSYSVGNLGFPFVQANSNALAASTGSALVGNIAPGTVKWLTLVIYSK